MKGRNFTAIHLDEDTSPRIGSGWFTRRRIERAITRHRVTIILSAAVGFGGVIGWLLRGLIGG